MSDDGGTAKTESGKWRRYALFGIPVTSAAIFFAAGIIFWGGFNTVVVATNSETFCISCHEMNDFVYEEYKGSIHDVNRSGVGAVCADCHVPRDWTHKMIRKVKATRELWGKITGSISTREKFEAKRLQLAMHEWERMKANDSRECRNCHDFESMMPEFQRPRARQQHLNAMEAGQTCIDCHKGVAHQDLRNRADEEYLEELEKPNPDFVREVPQAYLASLAYINEKEAEQDAKAEADAKAVREAEQARISAAVEAAREEERQIAAAATAAASGDGDAAAADDGAGAAAPTGDGVGAAIDWAGVEVKPVPLFYPGQASFEWVQTGKDHGGARAFRKAGDRCSNCHAKETADMGAKLVSGEKAEETPIPGKRPAIDMALQAAHDGENLYLRMQWQNGPHSPVPFVDGGKMDPDNEIKVAMMIAGTGIEMVEQAGCWATCHHDNRYMPHAPEADALAAAGDVAERIDLSDGITKYLTESRTKVEVAGRRGKIRGGWEKLKDAGEIDALVAEGAIMDLIRFQSGTGAENGAIMTERKMGDADVDIMGEGTLEGDLWTVVLSRPLASDQAGDVGIEPGQTYTVGFAIHDDFTTARFHHVSLEFTLALDDPNADINVTKQ